MFFKAALLREIVDDVLCGDREPSLSAALQRLLRCWGRAIQLLLPLEGELMRGIDLRSKLRDLVLDAAGSADHWRRRLWAAEWAGQPMALFFGSDCAARFVCLTLSADEELAVRQVQTRSPVFVVVVCRRLPPGPSPFSSLTAFFLQADGLEGVARSSQSPEHPRGGGQRWRRWNDPCHIRGPYPRVSLL